MPPGVPGVEVGNADEQKLWFENTLRDGVSPRMPGIGVHPVLLDDGKVVFVLRLPRSGLAAHSHVQEPVPVLRAELCR